MIGELFRARAAELQRGGRSRLYVELMREAADDADAGGIVAAIFAGDPATPASVPELRLLAALHHLVLSGGAPELARYFPSAGGDAPPQDAWAVARRTLAEHEAFIRERARRTVQTNEPGRCVALYGGLLWLSERHRLPIRLLEIGASAGLNLNPDRFAYVVDGAPLGDARSPLAFDEPWTGAPVTDPPAAAARLRIVERAGCDQAPIDPTSVDGRLELQSYIWPDEPARLARVELAASIAARHPVAIERRGAAAWLLRRLGAPRADVVTVIWQSVVDQYLEDAERAAIRSAFASAGGGPLAWLTLEPPAAASEDGSFELRCHERPEGNGSGESRLLARAGYHGPPVVWAVASPDA
ncbi:MAG: DUF2332 domain-containing protein [Solirubrobacteraceae bacterium]|nr:DUF2332 domain-containing protein [Solirubrobacteraceae bacterium]